ncbi:MAG: aminotransferase class III-fold pyridoxal phosphate-dependent enzyme [Candidatus Latescibacteria bacterium]|nr:aminotransferase class III-fold pyridoxal phosphate-dependent enzyme [Candidatus Latescibacterota bacterium]
MNNILVSYHESDDALGAPEAPRVVAACGGQPAAEYAETITLPWNRLDLLEDLFVKRGGEIAAVITEPVLANSGSIMPAEGFLKGMVDLCRNYGAVSIFDEVITGFRLALGGAREYFDVIPDLSVYAKALAGGFTLSAVAGSRRMFDVLRDGATIHAGTYNGSTVNLAAGLATLSILSANPLAFQQMHGHGYAIRQAIEAAAASRGIPVCISGAGTVFNVHFGVQSPPTHYRELKATDMALYNRFRSGMLEEGIQLLPDGRWYVGLTHGDAELKLVRAAVRSVVAEL